GRRREGLGHRLPARRPAVPAARGREADAPHVDPGAGRPPERVPDARPEGQRMMRPIARDEIVDYATYEDGREAFRARVLAAKHPRRVHLGEYITLLFENPLTVRYQIQEMIRTERIVREPDIEHEIATYNELLGGPGELGVTMLIEIDDPEARAAKLARWLMLPESVYLRLADGT